jgi:hypothetical protein
MQKIFISYRRTEAEYPAGALGRELRRHFGDQQIFRDKEDMGGGVPWKQQLLHEIDKDSALLVLMGKDWANAKDVHGVRRLDCLDDALRLEIGDGINDGAAIFPVLLENAQIPDRSELPPELRRLPEFNALKLRDGDWKQDVEAICRTLVRIGFKPVGSAPETPLGEQPAKTPGLKRGANVSRVIGAALIVSTIAIVGFVATRGKASPEPAGSLPGQSATAPGSTATPSNAGGQTSVPLLGGHAVFRYDPAVWQVDKSEPLNPGSFQYLYMSGQLRITVISQTARLTPDVLANTQLLGLQSLDTAAKMTRRGSRRVNGIDMVTQEFEAIYQIPLAFYAHYYMDTSGSIEFVGWTRPSLLDAYRPTIEQFVSGFELTGQKR